MQQPLATPYTIKQTLAQFNDLNQINPLYCKENCPYNKWMVSTKYNSKLFLKTSEGKSKYVTFHNILRNITNINSTKNNVKTAKDLKQYIEAIDTFITQNCTYDFFDAVIDHFHEENPNIYKKFLEPSLLLASFLLCKETKQIMFLTKYILEKKKTTNLQQMNKNIFVSLQCNYAETTCILFKCTNSLTNNNYEYNLYLDCKPSERLAILQKFINDNIEKRDLLTEIILSIFIQNSYLVNADNIPKLIGFLAEKDINLLNSCYDILLRLKDNKAAGHESYVLSKKEIQNEISQINCNCSINEIATALTKLKGKYPYFFIPVIEKKLYEFKLNINLSNIELNHKMYYIAYIIQQTKEIMKLKDIHSLFPQN